MIMYGQLIDEIHAIVQSNNKNNATSVEIDLLAKSADAIEKLMHRIEALKRRVTLSEHKEEIYDSINQYIEEIKENKNDSNVIR